MKESTLTTQTGIMGSAPSRHRKTATKVTAINSMISRRQDDTADTTGDRSNSPSRSIGTAEELQNGELSVAGRTQRPSLTGEGRSVYNIRHHLTRLTEVKYLVTLKNLAVYVLILDILLLFYVLVTLMN